MIEANESVEVWKKALRYIINNGRRFIDHRGRECIEVENLVVRVNSMQNIDKPIMILRRFDEWEFPPLEEIEDIILLRKEVPRYVFSAGSRLFNFSGTLNQIDDFVIPILQKDPFTRKATITFLDVLKDLKPNVKDIPSMISISFLIREGKVNLTAYIRSTDFFFGWAANIYQLFILQRYVSRVLGCELGSITTHSVSAHTYSDKIDKINSII